MGHAAFEDDIDDEVIDDEIRILTEQGIIGPDAVDVAPPKDITEGKLLENFLFFPKEKLTDLEYRGYVSLVLFARLFEKVFCKWSAGSFFLFLLNFFLLLCSVQPVCSLRVQFLILILSG